MEITAAGLRAVRMEKRKKRWCLAACSEIPFPLGPLHFSYADPGIADREDVGEVIRQTAEALGGYAGRAGLSLPNECIRIFIREFACLPETEEETEKMIRWWMEKSLRISPDNSLISWHLLGKNEKNRENVLIAVGSRDTICAWEMLFKACGIDPERIRPSGIDQFHYFCGEIPEEERIAYIAFPDRFLSLMMIQEGQPLYYQCIRIDSPSFLLHHLETLYENYREQYAGMPAGSGPDLVCLAEPEQGMGNLMAELKEMLCGNIRVLSGLRMENLCPGSEGGSSCSDQMPVAYSAAAGAALGLTLRGGK